MAQTPLGGAVTLRSGDQLPRVGLGVFKTPPKDTEDAVASALRLGYRHIDTAQVYGNEAEVGRAVSKFKAEHPGEKVFLTTKVWKNAWGYEKCREAVKTRHAPLCASNAQHCAESHHARDSLEKLGHIDLVLLHAPGDPVLRGDTWRALEACLAEGVVANIGVSNFGAAHLEKLAHTAVTPPAVNQIELHPALQRRELVAYCASQGICVEAYSPLAKGRLLNDATVCAVAAELGVTAAQVLLRWSVQKGFVTLPKSVSPERQAANLDLFSFALTGAHMAALDALERGFITGWDPITQDPV